MVALKLVEIELSLFFAKYGLCNLLRPIYTERLRLCHPLTLIMDANTFYLEIYRKNANALIQCKRKTAKSQSGDYFFESSGQPLGLILNSILTTLRLLREFPLGETMDKISIHLPAHSVIIGYSLACYSEVCQLRIEVHFVFFTL